MRLFGGRLGTRLPKLMISILRPSSRLLTTHSVSHLWQRSATLTRQLSGLRASMASEQSQISVPSSPDANQRLKRPAMDGASEAGPSEKKPRTQDNETASKDASKDATVPSRGKGKQKNSSRRAGRERRQRNREDHIRAGTRPEGVEGDEGEDNGEPKAARLPKRQCALLIGFCGSGYSGMQRCVFPYPTKMLEYQ